jgi:hypothetical protein
MPQAQFPFFPAGVTHITPHLAFVREQGQVTYFTADLPVFSHDETDHASFLMINAQFHVNGHAKQSDIVSAFGLAPITLKRAVKRLREQGAAGFYATPRRRGPAVLTPPVLAQARTLLDEGLEPVAVARRLGVKPDTLSKAIRAGRLARPAMPQPLPPLPVPASSKSARSAQDEAAPLGRGACDTLGRLAASQGELSAVAPQFVAALDVPRGGLLLALPALLALGLLETSERHFQLPDGYYGQDSLFLLLALMTLGRVGPLESLRRQAPGEWGKLLGLDRVPEVRTLRAKLHLLAGGTGPVEWSAALCQRWMAAAPAWAATLYVDGHVRVYHGSQTALPRHYVARERLCLRATTDYWVNAGDGQPFCVVNAPADPGIIRVLEGELLPRLERDVPSQPDAAALEADPWRYRFRLVFDREGYSPALFQRLWQRRIACITYRKRPGDHWPSTEFAWHTVPLVNGERVAMQLAERGVRLSGGPWLREVRRLTDSGHQTALVATDYHTPMAPLAAALFARWSQENYFRYARQHYGLDRLLSYATEPLSETIEVVNPSYRTLNSQVRALTAKRNRLNARFGAMNLEEGLSSKAIETFERRKGELREEIDGLGERIAELKAQRKEAPKRIQAGQLPEELRFRLLDSASKHFIDTVKMIAYRAETALANLLRDHLKHPDSARAHLTGLFDAEADLWPDPVEKTLSVHLHPGANACADRATTQLCEALNETCTVFPRTELRLVFKVGSGQNLGDQVV